MSTTTETLRTSNEEKLKIIKTSHVSLIPMFSSKEIPCTKSEVIIGCAHQRDTLQTAIVEKIDGKGVIHTSAGIRFSTKYYEIMSTQKIDDRYWFMFNPDKTYDRALKKIESDRIEELKKRHRDLGYAITRLDPITHADLIASLLNTIAENG